EIETRLAEELDIPVMHDDQHATAIVTLAGLMNAVVVAGKKLEDIAVVVNGAGAAGIAITKLLLDAGVTKITLVDSKGIIAVGRDSMNNIKDEVAGRINPNGTTGTLAEALVGADVFIGVSKANLVSRDMVASMAPSSIIFALANPDPEIMPDVAKAGGAVVVATGRSDFPNQVNNVLVYPGLFRGLLNRRAERLTPAMKLAAARALAGLVSPTVDRILPSILEINPAETIAQSIASV
ncbi:MAG: NAD-dependent malic enzyme, partial [Candidatus Uhrbacteria bacterium]|nr:NAD-dependent malic enzyme [Candidatus Uhrbacteria bacterium]